MIVISYLTDFSYFPLIFVHSENCCTRSEQVRTGQNRSNIYFLKVAVHGQNRSNIYFLKVAVHGQNRSNIYFLKVAVHGQNRSNIYFLKVAVHGQNSQTFTFWKLLYTVRTGQTFTFWKGGVDGFSYFSFIFIYLSYFFGQNHPCTRNSWLSSYQNGDLGHSHSLMWRAKFFCTCFQFFTNTF